jgi:hypothetical protein
VREYVIRIPRRALAAVAAVVALVVLVAVLSTTGVLARVTDPMAVASPQVVAAQQAAAERDIERAYEQATEQVRKVRRLNLAISAQQADTIATKALDDLKTLRHNGFVALGQVLGLAASDAEGYATATERRFEQGPISAQPSPSAVLLAPRLYAIVSRMSELSTQLSDKATSDLTAPAATPAPSATPSPTATRAPSPTPTPSPSR